MISIKNVTRRHFLNRGSKFLAIIPLTGVIGCVPDQDTSQSPENALKKLIFLIGPWTHDQKLIAENFADRFLKADHIILQYLPKSAKLIQYLSDRFPNNTWAVDQINLREIPQDEQELLNALATQLYSFVEVRFYVSNEPTWGLCQGDSKWHTRTPTQI